MEKGWCGSGCVPTGGLFYVLGKHVVKQSARLDPGTEVSGINKLVFIRLKNNLHCRLDLLLQMHWSSLLPSSDLRSHFWKCDKGTGLGVHEYALFTLETTFSFY